MNKKKNIRTILLIVFAGIMLNIFVVGGIVFIWFIPDIFHFDRYKGENPHLYTVAVNSLLTAGKIYTPHSYDSAKIIKLEEDEYGRELFVYSASTALSDGQTSSALICQAHDAEYAYWYDKMNYVLSPYESFREEFENGVSNDPQRGIPSEWLEELKEKNDWGKELDESRFSSASIVRETKFFDGNDEKANSFYNGLFGAEGYEGRGGKGVTRDKDGREIYVIYGVKRGEVYQYQEIIAITSPEGEFIEECWFVYDDSISYAEDLKRIKDAAGWNMKAE